MQNPGVSSSSSSSCFGFFHSCCSVLLVLLVYHPPPQQYNLIQSVCTVIDTRQTTNGTRHTAILLLLCLFLLLLLFYHLHHVIQAVRTTIVSYYTIWHTYDVPSASACTILLFMLSVFTFLSSSCCCWNIPTNPIQSSCTQISSTIENNDNKLNGFYTM